MVRYSNFIAEIRFKNSQRVIKNRVYFLFSYLNFLMFFRVLGKDVLSVLFVSYVIVFSQYWSYFCNTPLYRRKSLVNSDFKLESLVTVKFWFYYKKICLRYPDFSSLKSEFTRLYRTFPRFYRVFRVKSGGVTKVRTIL